MRYRILCAGWLASVVAGAGAATAADVAIRPVQQPAPIVAEPVYISDWSGFYIGGHGGGGRADPNLQSQFFSNSPLSIISTPLVSSLVPNPSGGVFGAQVGHNWQWGPAVGGLEIDFSGADINGTASAFGPLTVFGATANALFTREFKVDDLATARGRLGYLIFPNWLLYGTAGIAWGHSKLVSSEFANGFVTTTDTSFNQFGWVAGAGIEWKLWDHWLLRGEYLHYDFGSTAVPTDQLALVSTGAPLTSASPYSINLRNTVDIGRAALSYKF
jgi:outer membrane immunogenic protein